MNFKFLLIQANSPMDTLISPGLARLMGCLKERGIKIKVFDTTFYNTRGFTGDDARVNTLQVKKTDFSKYGIEFNKTDMIDDFVKVVKEYKPNLIGLSAVTCTYQHGLKLLNSVDGIPTIAGGVHPTVCPEDVIKEPSIDMVCIGEGDASLVELCEALRDGKDCTKIKNLWVKRDGKIYKNSICPPVNVNTLPTQCLEAFEERRLYKPMGGKIRRTCALELARYCAIGKCRYCTNEYYHKIYNHKNYQEFSVDKVIEEAKYFKEKFKIEYFYISTESLLTIGMKRFKEFVEKYKDIKIPFWCQTRPESVTEEKVKLLKEIGCECINIGIESGDPKLRAEVLNRRMTNQQIINAVRIVKKYGIRIGANNIIGLPTETRKQIFKTIELNRKAKPSSIMVHIFVPYNGTELYDLCVEKGFIPKGFDVSVHGGDYRSDFVLNMPQLPAEEIKGLHRTFALYTKFPKSQWSKIQKAEKFDKEGNAAFEELAEIYRRKYLAGSE